VARANPLPELLPASGSTQVFTDKPIGESIRLVAPSGSYHHYIVLEDSQTRKAALTVFMRAGESASINLPTGKYALRWISGRIWYGPKHLFGNSSIDYYAEDFLVIGAGQGSSGESRGSGAPVSYTWELPNPDTSRTFFDPAYSIRLSW